MITIILGKELVSELKSIYDMQNLLLRNQLLIINNQTKIMTDLSTIQAANETLIADVASEDTVIGSAVTLIEGFGAQLTDLQTQLAAAIAANDPVAIQAVADSLGASATDIANQTTALSAAITANTPAPAPAPAPDPAPAPAPLSMHTGSQFHP